MRCCENPIERITDLEGEEDGTVEYAEALEGVLRRLWIEGDDRLEKMLESDEYKQAEVCEDERKDAVVMAPLRQTQDRLVTCLLHSHKILFLIHLHIHFFPHFLFLFLFFPLLFPSPFILLFFSSSPFTLPPYSSLPLSSTLLIFSLLPLTSFPSLYHLPPPSSPFFITFLLLPSPPHFPSLFFPPPSPACAAACCAACCVRVGCAGRAVRTTTPHTPSAHTADTPTPSGRSGRGDNVCGR